MIINLAKYKRVTDELAIKALEKASDLTYTQVGQNLHSTFVLSKSTIYRIIKKTNVEKIESKSLIENSDKIHLQIDEKYAGIRGKNIKRAYILPRYLKYHSKEKPKYSAKCFLYFRKNRCKTGTKNK